MASARPKLDAAARRGATGRAADHRRDEAHVHGIARLDHCPGFERFFVEYMLPNVPVVFPATATADWPARRDWAAADSIDFAHLEEHYGEAVAPVVPQGSDPGGLHSCLEMSVREYLAHMQAPPGSDPASLYLKDWHFQQAFPDAAVYTTPPEFACDWLNAYCRTQGSDFRFVYIGAKGTRTQLHCDVMGSFSWSANIVGRKRWVFYPPSQTAWLKDARGAFPEDAAHIDGERFPQFGRARGIEVLQETGEVVFVPSGWCHWVENVCDTVSINHNWGNACNVDQLCRALCEDLQTARREIMDCRTMDGWHAHCQVLLRANCGLNFEDLLAMLLGVLLSVARRRRECAGGDAGDWEAALTDAMGPCRGDKAFAGVGRMDTPYCGAAMDLFRVARTLEALAMMGELWEWDSDADSLAVVFRAVLAQARIMADGLLRSCSSESE